MKIKRLKSLSDSLPSPLFFIVIIKNERNEWSIERAVRSDCDCIALPNWKVSISDDPLNTLEQ